MNLDEILNKIRETRIKEKKTLKYMSKELGNISVSSYCKRELGNTPMSLSDYLKICQILNKSPVYFFKRKLS